MQCNQSRQEERELDSWIDEESAHITRKQQERDRCIDTLLLLPQMLASTDRDREREREPHHLDLLFTLPSNPSFIQSIESNIHTSTQEDDGALEGAGQRERGAAAPFPLGE